MIHRILCCSDTHAELPPQLDESEAIAWLHGGDVVDGPTLVGDDADPLDDPLRAPTARWFTDRRVPVFIVRGNHDTADELRAFQNGRDITGDVVRIAAELCVAGVGWTGERYFELPLESDLKTVCDAVRRNAARVLTPDDHLVLLTHYPPRLPGMRELQNDPPNGGLWYDAVRELMEELPVVAVVQGHVHRWERSSQTVTYGGRDVLVFHPGRRGGVLLVDVATGSAACEWPPP